MASGNYKQNTKPVVSKSKVKPRSLDKETQEPKKGVMDVVMKTKMKKGWMGSDDGVMKA